MVNENVKRITYVLEKQINSGNRKFIVFPYGDLGHTTVKILNNKFKIKEQAIIDNALSEKNPNVKKIEYLEAMDKTGCVLLIASDNLDIYYEIRNLALKYMPSDSIVDIFENRGKIHSLEMYSIKDKIKMRLMNPRGKDAFCLSIRNKRSVKVLDVGCGNGSAYNLKKCCNKVFYIGLDVGNYNQTKESMNCMDKYLVVPPEKFSDAIEKLKGKIDIVISSHNIEHCNEPEKVLLAMINALKSGGKLYMAFPSEASVYFPCRGGCLNFYDDASHRYLPEYQKIVHILQSNSMKIIYKKKEYRPIVLRKVGQINEYRSRKLGCVLDGTWVYYRFESIIWAKKK